MNVRIKCDGVPLPAYETAGSAGMDIRAKLAEDLTLQPMERALIPTGISIELPQGCEAQIRARSGLAIKAGIGLVNGIGTIDSDYRGEIQVPLINWGQSPVIIKDKDRIAQMVVATYQRITWETVETLSQTQRNTGGFGHTGM